MGVVVHLLDEAGYVFLDRWVEGEPPERASYEGDVYELRFRAPGHLWYQVV